MDSFSAVPMVMEVVLVLSEPETNKKTGNVNALVRKLSSYLVKAYSLAYSTQASVNIRLFA